MKNEKGLTLIELLATITISVFVIGTMSALFFSIQNEWLNSAQNYNVQSKIELTLNTVSNYLANSDEVYTPSNSELRIRTGIGPNPYNYKAFVLQGNQLYLYDLAGVTDDTSFKSTIPSANYKNGLQLADNITNMSISISGQFVILDFTFTNTVKEIRIKLLNDSSS